MVSALAFGWNGPGVSHLLGHYVVFMGKTLNSHSAPHHPYKGVPTSIQSRGSRGGGGVNTLSRFMLRKPG